ncbi:hypothetical protein QL285_067059 [Trifolium repens]|nr:hypothetical protein QL285_067059 [Trifolium repens]
MIVGCKCFFESTERFTLGVEEGVVNLVGLCQNSMDSRRQEFLREDGRHSGVRRGCGVAARWLVGSWHHHRFKGKVEIVENCLENLLMQKICQRSRGWRQAPRRGSFELWRLVAWRGAPVGGARRGRDYIYACSDFLQHGRAVREEKCRVLKGGFTNMEARVQGGFSWVNPRVGYSF